MSAEPSIFGVLYRLAARAPALDRDALLHRLVTGLANHFDAVGCALHTDGSGWAAAVADPAPAVGRLSRLDRARLETLEARLVELARTRRRMASAMDLGDREDAEAFLQRTLGFVDVFAFPVLGEGEVASVIVLHLGEHSRPLRDPDLFALTSLGELLALAGA